MQCYPGLTKVVYVIYRPKNVSWHRSSVVRALSRNLKLVYVYNFLKTKILPYNAGEDLLVAEGMSHLYGRIIKLMVGSPEAPALGVLGAEKSSPIRTKNNCKEVNTVSA
jgi:hypothetical protein